MGRFIIRRILSAIPTLLITIALAFFMMRAAPGGPFDSDRKLPAAIEANINAVYHLDEPLWMQFLRYLGNVLRGDFGPSYKYLDFSVTQLIASGLPVSLSLGIAAVILGTVTGIFFGLLAAWRQNTALDHSVMAASMLGIAVPNFVMAPLMTLVLGLYLSLLPIGGWGGPSYWVLPILALALPKIGYVARLTRASAIEVLRSNFIRTARAKGLSERVVVVRHGLKAALLPVVSYLGPSTAGVITGSVVIESIFGIPGIGRYFVQGALNRDYTLVLGVVILYAAIIIALNLIVDLLYGVLDPKVRYE